jgi:hypothetical protein
VRRNALDFLALATITSIAKTKRQKHRRQISNAHAIDPVSGTERHKGLVEQYGDRLVCVRYRYDAEKKRRYKTVELIVEEAAWEPQPTPDTLMAIRVGADERTLQQQVRQAGGRWDAQRKVWSLRHERVIALGLQERVIGRWEGTSQDAHPGS